jgi:hypothetical protein
MTALTQLRTSILLITGCRPVQYQQELGACAGEARWHWARRLQQTVSTIQLIMQC